MNILVLDDSHERLSIFRRNIEKLNVLNANYTETSDDAINCLMLNPNYDYIFLDHDLGGEQMSWQENNCGMNVVDWIIANNYNNDAIIIIHSLNIPRATEMNHRLSDAGYSVISAPGAWNLIVS